MSHRVSRFIEERLSSDSGLVIACDSQWLADFAAKNVFLAESRVKFVSHRVSRFIEERLSSDSGLYN